MSQSINEWFASGRESNSSDDEHVEYKGRDAATGSDYSPDQGKDDAQSRGRRRAAASTRSGRPRQPTKVEYFLERVEFVAPVRVAELGAAARSSGLERGPANLSPYLWLPPARTPVVASPFRESAEGRKNSPSRSKKRKKNQASPKRTQRLPRRELAILDAQPCPACGLRPTINGVCLC